MTPDNTSDGLAQASDHPKRHHSFRPDIEGLRAIAILLVVGHHVGLAGFSGGYIGVDIFFVLSGYLITTLLLAEIDTTGTIDLIAFYARRARRLLPALIVVLSITMIVAFGFFSPVEQETLAQTAFWTAAYGSNIYFARNATNYFGDDVKANPFLHTWSLGVEEQFYLAWPVLVIVAIGATRWRKGSLHRQRLLLAMIGVFVGSLGLSIWLTDYRPAWAFYSSPVRAWEFAIGGLGVVIPRASRFRSFLPALRIPQMLSWIALACIIVVSTLFDATTPFPGIAALLPALSTIAILRTGATDKKSSIVSFLSVRPLQEIGRLSYSWYLWHWPVLTFATVLDNNLSLSVRLLLAVASLGIAELSYRWVENPIRHNRKLMRRRGYSMAMAAVLTGIGLVTAFGWGRVARVSAESPGQIRFTRASSDRPIIYKENCTAGWIDTEPVECMYGDDTSNDTIVLFGDSHAAHWFPAVEEIAREKGWRLATFTKSACPPTDVEDYYNITIRRVYTECKIWRHATIEAIARLHPAIVILTSSYTYPFTPDDWRNGTDQTIKRLNAATDAPIVQLRDWPQPEFNVPLCLARSEWRSRWIQSVPTCEFSRVSSESDAVYNAQKEGMTPFRNVYSLDLTGSVCPQTTCDVERDGTVVYSDSNHLTATFSRSLAPVLDKQLEHILSQAGVSE